MASKELKPRGKFHPSASRWPTISTDKNLWKIAVRHGHPLFHTVFPGGNKIDFLKHILWALYALKRWTNKGVILIIALVIRNVV